MAMPTLSSLLAHGSAAWRCYIAAGRRANRGLSTTQVWRRIHGLWESRRPAYNARMSQRVAPAAFLVCLVLLATSCSKGTTPTLPTASGTKAASSTAGLSAAAVTAARDKFCSDWNDSPPARVYPTDYAGKKDNPWVALGAEMEADADAMTAAGDANAPEATEYAQAQSQLGATLAKLNPPKSTRESIQNSNQVLAVIKLQSRSAPVLQDMCP